MKKVLVLPAVAFALSLAAPTVASAAPEKHSDSPQYEIREGEAPTIGGKITPQLNPAAALSCNLGDSNAIIASSKSKYDKKISLKCGTDGWGYKHIREEHKKDWTKVNADSVENWPFWDDLMWDATSRILKDPDFTLKKPNNKRCYTKSFKIYYATSKKLVEFYPTVIVATDSNKIITSFPTKEHLCQP